MTETIWKDITPQSLRCSLSSCKQVLHRDGILKITGDTPDGEVEIVIDESYLEDWFKMRISKLGAE